MQEQQDRIKLLCVRISDDDDYYYLLIQQQKVANSQCVAYKGIVEPQDSRRELGIPGNFGYSGGGNYGEFIGILSFFQFLLLIMTF